jgi:hypothetical protein
MDRDLAVEPTVSWNAIWAGAIVSLATALLITLLAAGFGFSLSYGGLATHASLTAFTPMVGAGAIAVQVVSAGIGGYLVGRLRHVWLYVHIDEAHFRDTAHGLVSWALATLIGVVLVALVLTPYAQQLAGPAIAATPVAVTADDAARSTNILAQSSFFAGIGLLLSAFTAAVAARVGGLHSEAMLAKLGTTA